MMRAAIYVVLGVLMGIGAAACSSSTSAQGPSGKLNLVVVCVSCIPDDMPQEAYNSGNILLDQNTGDLWFYPALSPGVKPRLMGTQKSDSPGVNSVNTVKAAFHDQTGESLAGSRAPAAVE